MGRRARRNAVITGQLQFDLFNLDAEAGNPEAVAYNAKLDEFTLLQEMEESHADEPGVQRVRVDEAGVFDGSEPRSPEGDGGGRLPQQPSGAGGAGGQRAEGAAGTPAHGGGGGDREPEGERLGRMVREGGGSPGQGAGDGHPRGGGGDLGAPAVDIAAQAGGGPKAHAERNIRALRTLRALTERGGAPTAEEAQALASYSGWGPCADAFSDKPEWGEAREALESLLSPDELASARSSVLTAYYTPAPVIAAMYAGLDALGFGRNPRKPDFLLEPSCGIGNFIAVAPKGYRITGVEVDPLSATIAQKITAGAEIVCAPFEECRFPEGSYDAVIGNIPFSGDIRIPYDGVDTLAIHDYFLHRSLDAVRPGGVVAVVASRFVLDKTGERVRRELAERAELIACVRLPDDAFSGQASTSVSTDVLFFRKRFERAEGIDEPWVHVIETDGLVLNAWVASDPQRMAGALEAKSGPFGPRPSVRAEGDLGSVLREKLLAQLGQPGLAATRELMGNRKGPEPFVAQAPKLVGDYEYVLDPEGRLWFGNGSTVEVVEHKSPGDRERLAAMVRVRDAVRSTLALEASPSATDEDAAAAIASLDRMYTNFVSLFGRISDRRNISLYDRTEASYYLVSGLELRDAKGKFSGKADVFKKRVVAPVSEVPSHVDLPEDALAVSMDQKGRVDLAYIAELLGTTPDGAVERLGDLVVVDPATGETVEAEAYLSGNLAEKRDFLKAKLREAVERPVLEQRLSWLESIGMGRGPEPSDSWDNAKAALAKKGIWAAATNPYGASRYSDPVAALADRSLPFSTHSFPGRGLRDLLVEAADAGASPDPKLVGAICPRYEISDRGVWGTFAGRALAVSVFAPGSAELMGAVLGGGSADYIAAARRAAGLADAPSYSAEGIKPVMRALADDPALPEYLASVAMSARGRYGLYLGASPEGLAAFKERRGSYFEASPQRTDADEVRRLESLLGRVKEAMPPRLDAGDIALTLGSHWVPAKIVHDFAVEAFGLPERDETAMRHFVVTRTDIVGQWKVRYSGLGGKVKESARDAYGTPERSCFDILASALNSTSLTVTKEGPDGEKVKDHQATVAAWDKRRALVNRFKEWCFSDPARAEVLCRIYNDRFNCVAPREYSGAKLTLPGISPLISLSDHQRDAIARSLRAPEGSLIAHVVGAGKTFDGIAATYEARRLGRAKKPLIVVPNHLTEQWAGDYMTLYPSARILVMGKGDMADAASSKRFWGRAATGDWDAVIVAQSRFSMIPVSPKRRIAGLEARREEFVEARTAAEGDESFSVKQIEAQMKIAERKIGALRQERDSEGVYFDNLGFDMLVVDEAHTFKNLAVATSMSVAGISVAGSQKCEDLLDKCEFVREAHPGNLVFLTGTPVSNSMSELYNMFRYLAPKLLESLGVSSFGAWASTFGEIVESVELKPEGTGFQLKQRFGRFHNLPELMSAVHVFADIKTNDDISLDVPECEIVPVAVEATPEQAALVEVLAERASQVRAGLVDPDVDNMLKITSDGRKIALDPKLLDPDDPDVEPLSNGKVAACAANVKRIWRQTAPEKGSQLVFCDASTPASGKWNIYHDLREKLVSLGVPAAQIAFVSDAANPRQREELFGKVRRGEVRVLLGSTQKLGTGTNVQERLAAIHDLDCPWRPSDLEQRLGRIVRRGNGYDEVKAYRYVTVGTFDSYLFQTVQSKQSFISQVFTSKSPAREASDLDETVLSYAEIKALATGDPDIQRRMEIENRVGQLKLLRSAHVRQASMLNARIEGIHKPRVEALERELEAALADAPAARAAPAQNGADGEWIGMVVGGVRFSDREQAARALWDLRAKGRVNEPAVVGTYRGFEVAVVHERTATADTHDIAVLDKIAVKGVFLHPASKPMPAVFSGSGSVVSQLDRIVSDLAERDGVLAAKLDQARAELAEAEATATKPWEHEEEYQRLAGKLEDIEHREKERRRPVRVPEELGTQIKDAMRAAEARGSSREREPRETQVAI